MGGAAGAGDDDLEALRACALGEIDQPVHCAVRRNDARVIGNFQRLQRVGGVFMVSQSDWLPMMMATGGLSVIVAAIPSQAMMSGMI